MNLARAVLREPLVYFVLAGALVFAVDTVARQGRDTIRVTRAVRDEIARSLHARLGHEPDAEQTRAELELWEQQQALYREAVKMGLDDDPTVRAHIAAKLLQIAGEREVLPEATDAELRDFLERHRSGYTTPATFDFDVDFVAESQGDARARADDLLARLRAGASPEGLGDWLPRGHRFTGESLAEITALFGEQAARQMSAAALGEWSSVPGPRGLYLVRVTAADRGEPRFEALRPSLVLGYEAERRERAAEDFARKIEGHYRFVTVE